MAYQYSQINIIFTKKLDGNLFRTIAEDEKLQMFYNAYGRNGPNYLYDLIPPSIQNTTSYPSNGDHTMLPICRRLKSSDSFISSTIRQWNKLDISARKNRNVIKI